MFIQEQMAKIVEMNDAMQDVVTDITAKVSPITSVYTGAGMPEYLRQIAQWNDVICSLLL